MVLEFVCHKERCRLCVCFSLAKVFVFVFPEFFVSPNFFATKRVAVERESSLLGKENILSLCFLLSSSFPFPEFLFLSFQRFFCHQERCSVEGELLAWTGEYFQVA